MIAASEGAERALTNFQLAQRSLTLGRQAFQAGDIDLIELNIYEQAVNDAEIIWIDARAAFFSARAAYDAVLVRNPLPL